jgi:hypothetical protein
MSGKYPVGVEVAPGARVARWRPLGNWLLALPLLLWLIVVSCGAVGVLAVAWFAIVCTGRMPGRLGDYLMGVLRYGWRVCAFLFGLTDCYPGFRLIAGYVDPGNYPAVFYSAQPLDRSRVAVLLRLVLVVPLLLLSCLTVVLGCAALVVGWGSVLIVGYWPPNFRSLLVGCCRWGLIVTSYGWLIVDTYPLEENQNVAEETPAFVAVQPDPREVTGPPWPRLVGGEAYQAPGLLRWPIVVGVVLLASNFGLLAASAPAPPRTQAPATSSPATGEIIDDLEARILPAPAGYYAMSGLFWPNGMSPAAYDHWLGAGAAADLTFLGGYEASYPSSAYDDLVDIQLLRFSSPHKANQAMGLLSLRPEEASKQSAFSAIRGARALDGTEPFNGYYDHLVLATKGPLAMVLDYVASYAGSAPIDFAVWAVEQYRLL